MAEDYSTVEAALVTQLISDVTVLTSSNLKGGGDRDSVLDYLFRTNGSIYGGWVDFGGGFKSPTHALIWTWRMSLSVIINAEGSVTIATDRLKTFLSDIQFEAWRTRSKLGNVVLASRPQELPEHILISVNNIDHLFLSPVIIDADVRYSDAQ